MALRAPLDEKPLSCRKQPSPLFVRRDRLRLPTQPRMAASLPAVAGVDQFHRRQWQEQKNCAKRDSLHHGWHLLRD
jgi:hypothetical protein